MFSSREGSPSANSLLCCHMMRRGQTRHLIHVLLVLIHLLSDHILHSSNIRRVPLVYQFVDLLLELVLHGPLAAGVQPPILIHHSFLLLLLLQVIYDHQTKGERVQNIQELILGEVVVGR
jgi:hypothetical protein